MPSPAASSSPFAYELERTDPGCSARVGTFSTPHGPVPMPAFMAVGTQGTVKGVVAELLRGTGGAMILANTYHLAIRPGEKIVRELGGLHTFMDWSGPILTDSGGFQIFSLAARAKITEQGAFFRSHLDGSLLELTPERAIAIQEDLGADIAMVLDHCPPLPGSPGEIREACERTVRWAERCQRASTRTDQAKFGIVQGGLDPQLRAWCARELRQLDFPGYAIGGLSVGEEIDAMYRTLDAVCPELPENKPRYLMGVGRPQDLLEAISRGVDLFDCVLPTRNGRNAMAFTDAGPIRLRNAIWQLDRQPLEEGCPCPACRHSRGYLRHLFLANEMLGPILVSIHNLTYYQRLVADSRQAIRDGRFVEFAAAKRAGWETKTTL